jgi:hypothetical protein
MTLATTWILFHCTHVTFCGIRFARERGSFVALILSPQAMILWAVDAATCAGCSYQCCEVGNCQQASCHDCKY